MCKALRASLVSFSRCLTIFLEGKMKALHWISTFAHLFAFFHSNLPWCGPKRSHSHRICVVLINRTMLPKLSKDHSAKWCQNERRLNRSLFTCMNQWFLTSQTDCFSKRTTSLSKMRNRNTLHSGECQPAPFEQRARSTHVSSDKDCLLNIYPKSMEQQMCKRQQHKWKWKQSPKHPSHMATFLLSCMPHTYLSGQWQRQETRRINVQTDDQNVFGKDRSSWWKLPSAV